MDEEINSALILVLANCNKIYNIFNGNAAKEKMIDLQK